MAVPQAPPYLRNPTAVPTETRPAKFTYEDPRTPGPSCVSAYGDRNAWLADTQECSNEHLHQLFEDQTNTRCDNFCPIAGCQKRLSFAGPTVLRTICAHCQFVTKRYTLLWACTCHGRGSMSYHHLADQNGACFFCVDCVFTYECFAQEDEHNFAQLYQNEPVSVHPQWLERSERRTTERHSAASSSHQHRLPDLPNWNLPRRLDSLVWAENFLSLIDSRRRR